MARYIESFQFPMDSSSTPYNQSDFSPEVVQLCQDEADLLLSTTTLPSSNQQHINTKTKYNNKTTITSTTTNNPFSLAISATAAKNQLRVAKCIVVGDISVGKTTLINRFITDHYTENYKATIGVDFEVQKFEILGRPFTLQVS